LIFVKNSVAAVVESRLTKHPGRGHALMHILMLTATLCWAANIIAGKVVLRTMGSLPLAQLRVTAGAVIFVTLFLAWHGRPKLRLRRGEWAFLGKTALFGITLNQVFFIGGIGRTSAAHSGLIVALGPVMVLALACAMRLEALTLMKSIGTFIAFVGVAVLTGGNSASSTGATVAGDAMMFAGSTVFSYYTILMKGLIDRCDALSLNAVTFSLGALFMIPFSARAVVNVHWLALPARTWWYLAFIVVLGTAVSYMAYTFALTELTAARVAAFSYLQPVIAIGLGAWLLGEKLTPAVVLGGGLILLGVYLTEREVEQDLTNYNR
jgi:drug/metabolite transporter (DMT)-like permease